MTPDVIAAAAGKLDDPLLLNWAIDRYEELPRKAVDVRAHMESVWFHDVLIAQLLERGEPDMLARLFRSLPPARFANVTASIVRRWAEWPDAVAGAAAKPLAANAPETLPGLYEEWLKRVEQGRPLNVTRLYEVDLLAQAGTEERRRGFFDRLCTQALALSDSSLDKLLLLPIVLRSARFVSLDGLEDTLAVAFELDTAEHRRDHCLRSLFQGLFGQSEFFDLVEARFNQQSAQRIQPLAPLFAAGAPLAVLDGWIDRLPPLDDLDTLLQEASQRSMGCAAIRHLIRQLSKTLTEPLASRLAVAACLEAHTLDTLDVSTLDLPATVALLAADLDQPRWQPQLLEHLTRFPADAVIPLLTSCLSEVAESYGSIHIADAMGTLGCPAFVPGLIDALGEDSGDFLREAAQSALQAIGPPAQAALIRDWETLDPSQQIHGLSVIQEVGGPAAVEFALARFDALMDDTLEFCCELMSANPDPRLLDRLRPELRRKQPLIDRACYLMALLLDVEDQEILAARERALADLQKSRDLRDALERGDFSRDSLSLELRCPACQAVNRYDVRGVVMGAGEDRDAPPVIADEFPCASCGQEVEFELTTMARMALVAELVLANSAEVTGPSRQALVTARNVQINGVTMPLGVALARLRERLQTNPGDARAWLQLGNIFAYINRPKARIDALRRAARLAPGAADVHLALAESLTAAECEGEAFQLLAGALERMSAWRLMQPYAAFTQEFTSLYNRLRLTLGRNDLPALHPSALPAAGKKVGRNDPCPCGSGKKFKKCCGA